MLEDTNSLDSAHMINMSKVPALWDHHTGIVIRHSSILYVANASELTKWIVMCLSVLSNERF